MESVNSLRKVQSSHESPYHYYKKIKTLGKGSYGEVIRVEEKSTG